MPVFAISRVSNRRLLSTATTLAFAVGFGSGVLGAWLVDRPADRSVEAALPVVEDGGAPMRLAHAGLTARRSVIEALDAAAGRPTVAAPPPAVAPAGGLSREAESAGQARLAKAAA